MNGSVTCGIVPIDKVRYPMRGGRLEEIKVLHAQTQTSISHITYEHDANGFVEHRTEHVEGRDEVFHNRWMHRDELAHVDH
jgi:hypothetical protein